MAWNECVTVNTSTVQGATFRPARGVVRHARPVYNMLWRLDPGRKGPTAKCPTYLEDTVRESHGEVQDGLSGRNHPERDRRPLEGTDPLPPFPRDETVFRVAASRQRDYPESAYATAPRNGARRHCRADGLSAGTAQGGIPPDAA